MCGEPLSCVVRLSLGPRLSRVVRLSVFSDVPNQWLWMSISSSLGVPLPPPRLPLGAPLAAAPAPGAAPWAGAAAPPPPAASAAPGGAVGRSPSYDCEMLGSFLGSAGFPWVPSLGLVPSSSAVLLSGRVRFRPRLLWVPLVFSLPASVFLWHLDPEPFESHSFAPLVQTFCPRL